MIKKFLFGKNWFFEDFLPDEPKTSIWGFPIEKKIYSGKSPYQKIEIFQTKKFGRILALDGEVQLSVKDEYVYHEMLVHPAFLCQGNPKKVLIIGGGDGGSLREVVKHKNVEEVFLVDIDKKVIEVSKKYLPSLSGGSFNDKRLKVYTEDALGFVKNFKNFFDIIIEDLTDPRGPSLFLWQKDFYKILKNALNKNGVVSFQSGWLKDIFSKKARKEIKESFSFFKIHRAYVGCYPLGEHAFSLASKNVDFKKISFQKINQRYKKSGIKTRYYCPEIHFASGILPKF